MGILSTKEFIMAEALGSMDNDRLDTTNLLGNPFVDRDCVGDFWCPECGCCNRDDCFIDTGRGYKQYCCPGCDRVVHTESL